MHSLLIQQAILDEVARQVQLQGKKALVETKFDLQLISPALTAKKITAAEIDRWAAHLHIEGYYKLTADDHHRNPMYITMLPKGLSAESSRYFEEKYRERRRANVKYWVDIIGQTLVGVTAIIALLISANVISCNKSTESTPRIQNHNTPAN